MIRQNTEDFQGDENTLYDIIMLDISHYTFFQTEYTRPRMNSKMKYGF